MSKGGVSRDFLTHGVAAQFRQSEVEDDHVRRRL
jgi:hypothetical protein